MIAMKNIIYATIASLLLPAATALAERAPDGYEQIPLPDASIRWGAVGFSIVFLLVISAVAFKNAKRTHLD